MDTYSPQGERMSGLVDTSAIGQWRAIVTLIAFIIASEYVLRARVLAY